MATSTSRRRNTKTKTGRRSSSRRIRSHVVQTKTGRRYRVTTFPSGKTVRKVVRSPEQSSASIMRAYKDGRLHQALAWQSLKKTWHGKVPAEYAHMKWTKKKKAKRSTAGKRKRRRN
jgi:hypothetical protein